jgi:hypothetical protein
LGKAIRFAPSDDQIFGIALSNKAQCLIRLNKNVTEALKLLDLAEESTYPKEKMDKLQNNRNIAKKLLNTSMNMIVSIQKASMTNLTSNLQLF